MAWGQVWKCPTAPSLATIRMVKQGPKICQLLRIHHLWAGSCTTRAEDRCRSCLCCSPASSPARLLQARFLLWTFQSPTLRYLKAMNRRAAYCSALVSHHVLAPQSLLALPAGDSKRRWLAYNTVGCISSREEEDGSCIVEVAFHDTTLNRRRVPLLRDYHRLTMASLSEKVRPAFSSQGKPAPPTT